MSFQIRITKLKWYLFTLIWLLLVFNGIELIGSFLVNGDWGWIVLTNFILIFVIMILLKEADLEEKNE